MRAIAWKAQVRLSARYRRLVAAGKRSPKPVVAIARELAGLIWAIARWSNRGLSRSASKRH
jgi:transposase